MWKRPHPSEDGEALRIAGDYARQEPASTPPIPVLDSLQPATRSAHWFVLFTASRHEKRVATHLANRQIECYLPLYRSCRKWSDGTRITLDLPLFPNYVFIRMHRGERGSVLAVPGVLSVVGGTGGELAQLPDATIDELKTGLHLGKAQPHPLIMVGQKVRIRAGSLAGLNGIVVRNKSSFRVVITLEQIMRSYAVEVDLEDVELL
jgi:transcription antitermination factor NusG